MAPVRIVFNVKSSCSQANNTILGMLIFEGLVNFKGFEETIA